MVKYTSYDRCCRSIDNLERGKIHTIMNDIDALQNFLLDIECLDELLPWTGKFNIFDVLKISRTEIRHSNMLSWLFDSNETHGIGDKFLRSVVQRIVENDNQNKYSVIDILMMDFGSFTVYREWKNIDILLVSNEEKFLIAIENKVGSHEHSNQLNRYRKILENDFSEFGKMYVYLTPDGEDPSDTDNWDVFTYSEVLEILEHISGKVELRDDVKLMIDNYIDVLRRDIVEDKKLIEICDKIYNKHRHALDLIYEHRTDSRNVTAKYVRELLSSRDDIEFDEDGSNNTVFVFHTKEMSEILPNLKEKNSSWKNVYPYMYWIECYSDNIVGHFEFGGDNVPQSIFDKMQQIIDILNPKVRGREQFKYKRIYRTKKYKQPDMDDEDALRDIIEKIVSELLDMQKKLIEDINYN